MQNVLIVGNVDWALLALWAFFLFFIALVFYLHRESYREGYPLEDEISGKYDGRSALLLIRKKTFKLPFGRGSVTVPDASNREPVEIAARRLDRSPGSPYVPTGNPLVDGVGPASYANRAKLPDLDYEGHPRIVPIGASGLWIEGRDPDPRGMTVTGVDNAVAGTVTDIWVDKADRLIRYLAVDIGARTVLAPMFMAKINRRAKTVRIDAVRADQFADAPAVAGPGTITLFEEERVQAYFGGGYLYATRARQEPIL
jgi:photosynthetic reaction center H subunit